MFLAHFTGGGINDILDLYTDDFYAFLEEATKIYKTELTTARRVVLAGIER